MLHPPTPEQRDTHVDRMRKTKCQSGPAESTNTTKRPEQPVIEESRKGNYKLSMQKTSFCSHERRRKTEKLQPEESPDKKVQSEKGTETSRSTPKHPALHKQDETAEKLNPMKLRRKNPPIPRGNTPERGGNTNFGPSLSR